MKHGPKAAIPSYWNLLWLVPAAGVLFLLRFRSRSLLGKSFFLFFFFNPGGMFRRVSFFPRLLFNDPLLGLDPFPLLASLCFCGLSFRLRLFPFCPDPPLPGFGLFL